MIQKSLHLHLHLSLCFVGAVALSGLSGQWPAQASAEELQSFPIGIDPLDGSNSAQKPGIQMQFLDPPSPDRFILTIPDRRFDPQAFTQYQLPLALTNHTPHPICPEFAALMPELIGPDEQPRQRQRNPNYRPPKRFFGGRLTLPGERREFQGSAVLYWENKRLLLKASTQWLAGAWYFDDIEPGNYQLRFTYRSSGKATVCTVPKVPLAARQKICGPSSRFLCRAPKKFFGFAPRRIERTGKGTASTPFLPLQIVASRNRTPPAIRLPMTFKFPLPPDPFVVAIPNNSVADQNPFLPKLTMELTNTTAQPICPEEEYLQPELIDPAGQPLQRQPMAEHIPAIRGNGGFLVKSGHPTSLNANLGLYWQDGQWHLQIASPGPLYGRNGLWSFAGIEPGDYQLRFIYRSTGAATTCTFTVFNEESLPSSFEHQAVETPGKGWGATEFITLRVASSVRESTAIEIDGVRFEVLVPEQQVLIPPRQPGAETPVSLTLRITNHSDRAYQFTPFKTLRLQFWETRTRILKAQGFEQWIDWPRLADFQLLRPGEQIDFAVEAKLYWQEGKLRLGGINEFGKRWYFDNLKTGSYQIRFLYFVGDRMLHELSCCGVGEEVNKVRAALWRSQLVDTPWVELHLVRP